MYELFTEFDIRGRMWLVVKNLYTHFYRIKEEGGSARVPIPEPLGSHFVKICS